MQAGQEEPTPTQRPGLKRQRAYGNTTNIVFGDLQDLSLYLLLDVFLLHLSLQDLTTTGGQICNPDPVPAKQCKPLLTYKSN